MSKGGRPLTVHPDLEKIRDYVEAGDQTKLQSLLRTHGTDAYDDSRRTTLTWAAFFGNTPILDWLIEAGGDLNHQDRIGYTGLHFAAQEKRPIVVSKLLSAGADPNLTDLHGNGPLWMALMNTKDDFAIVRALVEAGAVSDKANKHGRSPDRLAMEMFGKPVGELFGAEERIQRFNKFSATEENEVTEAPRSWLKRWFNR